MLVVGTGHRPMTVCWGRYGAVRLLHFAAAWQLVPLTLKGLLTAREFTRRRQGQAFRPVPEPAAPPQRFL